MAGATLCALVLAVGLADTTPVRAEGLTTFSLHRFAFSRYADGDLDYFARWRITVCTSGPARLRIRAVLQSDFPGSEQFRFVRRQPEGCTRHFLRRPGANDEGPVTSMLRVAWRDQRRHTRWIEAGDPAPD
jgi:hypothetical protein